MKALLCVLVFCRIGVVIYSGMITGDMLFTAMKIKSFVRPTMLQRWSVKIT